jgi:putative spermidine/putrescine transport system ATP-binding protein
MTGIVLRALSKTYPGAARPALDAVSLEVRDGESVALLGPSGCGKTTALRLIAGLLEPSSGDIAFDGRSVLRDRPEVRGAVMMFQGGLLFPHLNVADNVGFGLRMRKLPKAQIAARVAEMLKLVRLPDFGPRRVSGLSGGQQQRVALARALIVRPRVLLLDEPLSNLDAHLRTEMRDLVSGVQKDLGLTTVFVTHDQEDAVAVADRIALVLDGRLHQYDVPEAFYRRPADASVADFFGARNFIPGVSAGSVFDGPVGRLVLPPGVRAGKGLLTFRPEAVRMGPAAENSLSGVVAERQYLGTRTRLRLMVGDRSIEAVVPPDAVAGTEPGATVTFNLPRDALWVVAEA